MKNIAVFCSANEHEKKYTKPTEEFARLMVLNGYNLVWGGGRSGLMKVVASTVKSSGGNLIGVSTPVFSEFIWTGADEIVVAETLFERKSIMLERSDAIVALVGGIGTLDEITEMVELKKQKQHDKPIVILNTKHFYDGLINLLQKMHHGGFVGHPLEDLIHFSTQPQEAIDYLKTVLG